MSLNGEIGDFAGLVGLLLALATLLTANRSSTLDTIKKSASPERADVIREIVLDSGLAFVTALVLAAGIPLWIRAVRDLHPLAHGGPLRSVFTLSWILLVCLVGWQINLVRSGSAFLEKVPQ